MATLRAAAAMCGAVVGGGSAVFFTHCAPRKPIYDPEDIVAPPTERGYRYEPEDDTSALRGGIALIRRGVTSTYRSIYEGTQPLHNGAARARRIADGIKQQMPEEERSPWGLVATGALAAASTHLLPSRPFLRRLVVVPAVALGTATAFYPDTMLHIASTGTSHATSHMTLDNLSRAASAISRRVGQVTLPSPPASPGDDSAPLPLGRATATTPVPTPTPTSSEPESEPPTAAGESGTATSDHVPRDTAAPPAVAASKPLAEVVLNDVQPPAAAVEAPRATRAVLDARPTAALPEAETAVVVSDSPAGSAEGSAAVLEGDHGQAREEDVDTYIKRH